jgi:HK97 family phage major capsid protein
MDNSRLRELQSALEEKVAANRELADSVKIEDGTLILEPEHKTEFDKNMRDIKEIKGLIESMKELDGVESWSSEPAGDSVATEAQAAQAAAAAQTAASFKSLGQQFVESEEFKALNGGRSGVNMHSPFEYKGVFANGGYNVKDVYTALPSGDPGEFGRIQRDPIVESAKRNTRVRDLFPARTTTAAVIEYFRVVGYADNPSSPASYTTTNSASVVPERNEGNTSFGLKPQTNLQFVGEQAPVRTIAHWEAAHRNVLADEPQLRSIIDNELLYGLRLQEDAQILSGTGTGEDLQGLLTNSLVQDYALSSGPSAPVADTKADAIRRAATLAFLAYYEPTGVVLNPFDWEDIELNKDNEGRYLMAVSIQQGAEARIWRMPVIDTPAMPEGTALVGAFGTGSQLYDREGSTIRISENHEDFFVRNAIVVLAEQRLALATKRPESFVKVDFLG